MSTAMTFQVGTDPADDVGAAGLFEIGIDDRTGIGHGFRFPELHLLGGPKSQQPGPANLDLEQNLLFMTELVFECSLALFKGGHSTFSSGGPGTSRRAIDYENHIATAAL